MSKEYITDPNVVVNEPERFEPGSEEVLEIGPATGSGATIEVASRAGMVEVPEEPTLAMLRAGASAIADIISEGTEYDVAAQKVWSQMLDARNIPDIDTKALFDASPDEIRKALVLYRKMTKPRKRKGKTT